MSQKFAQEALLKALESRFDYSSARTILKRLLKACGLTDGQDLSAEEVALVAERFAAVEPKADRVIARLRDLSGGAAPTAKAPAAPTPAPVEAAPAIEEAPAVIEEAPAVVEEAPAVIEEAPAAPTEEAEDADGDEAKGEEGEGEEGGNSGGNRRGKRGRK